LGPVFGCWLLVVGKTERSTNNQQPKTNNLKHGQRATGNEQRATNKSAAPFRAALHANHKF
jgi:hypothetical protein